MVCHDSNSPSSVCCMILQLQLHIKLTQLHIHGGDVRNGIIPDEVLASQANAFVYF